jgi:hypothetical protein
MRTPFTSSQVDQQPKCGYSGRVTEELGSQNTVQARDRSRGEVRHGGLLAAQVPSVGEEVKEYDFAVPPGIVSGAQHVATESGEGRCSIKRRLASRLGLLASLVPLANGPPRQGASEYGADVTDVEAPGSDR